jgi:hypothetical protein
MSDRAIPRSLRFMEGFGVHTFRLVNAEDARAASSSSTGSRCWALPSAAWDEAVKLATGPTPISTAAICAQSIDGGHFPGMGPGQVQVFDEAWAAKLCPIDVLDATKLIPEEEILPADSRSGALSLEPECPTISLPRPSRSPSCPPMWCRGSISRTIRCCKGGCSAISTRRNRGWARPISTRSRSTRPSARSTISSATG